MTKNDYELIAKTIKEANDKGFIPDTPTAIIAELFAIRLHQKDSSFQWDKFRRACGIPDATNKERSKTDVNNCDS